MAERILELERRPGEEYVLRFRPSKLRFLPETTRQHTRAAQKELLLAVRSLIDGAIERLEEAEKRKGKPRTKIEVE